MSDIDKINTLKCNNLNANTINTSSINNIQSITANTINNTSLISNTMNASYLYTKNINATKTPITLNGVELVKLRIGIRVTDSSGTNTTYKYNVYGFRTGTKIQIIGFSTHTLSSYKVARCNTLIINNENWTDSPNSGNHFILIGYMHDTNHIYRCIFSRTLFRLYQTNGYNYWTNFTTPGFITFGTLLYNLSTTEVSYYIS